MPAADSHLRLLICAFNEIKYVLPSLDFNHDHQHQVGSLTLLHKIYYSPDHSLHYKLSPHFRPSHGTRYALQSNDPTFSSVFL